MKLLLTIIMSTVVSASAFAACGISTIGECNTKVLCDGLSKADGPKFTFDTATNKCMVADTSVATNCTQVNNASGGNKSQVDTETPVGAPARNGVAR